MAVSGVPQPSRHPADRRVGKGDVEAIEAETRALRADDYQSGGGGCRDAVLAHLADCQALLDSPLSSTIADRLQTAVADLSSLAGWICFDAGRPYEGITHLSEALKLALQVRHRALAANIHYRLGRIWLHHNELHRALTEFRHASYHAKDALDARGAAILAANQAWTYARMASPDRALALLDQATGHFADVRSTEPAVWDAFFTETDMQAMTGVVHSELARTTDTRHCTIAIPLLTRMVAAYGTDMNRSKALCTIALATSQLLDDDIDAAVTNGHQALAMCRALNSPRTAQRLRPLKNEADRRRRSAAARDLSHDITTLLADNVIHHEPIN